METDSHFTQADRERMITHGVKLERAIEDIRDVKENIAGITSKYVSIEEYKEHLLADADHEERIRAIERSVWKWIGASSILTAVGSLAASAIIQHFIH